VAKLSKRGFIRDFPLDRKSVIPAKAGIQLIENSCKAGHHLGFVRYAGCLLLDPRLREDDE
jgi:hypothetical protein